MIWPYTRLTTYQEFKGTVVSSTDLNKIQDSLISLQSRPLRIMDDFIDLQDPLTTGGNTRYTVDQGAGGTTKIDDNSPGGAYGALKIVAVGDGTGVASVQVCSLRSDDFRFITKTSATASGGANVARVSAVGIADVGLGNFYGHYVSGTGNWVPMIKSATPTPIGGGVAVSGSYQILEFNRISGTFNLYVDGVLIYTAADNSDLSAKVVSWYDFQGSLFTDWYGF